LLLLSPLLLPSSTIAVSVANAIPVTITVTVAITITVAITVTVAVAVAVAVTVPFASTVTIATAAVKVFTAIVVGCHHHNKCRCHHPHLFSCCIYCPAADVINTAALNKVITDIAVINNTVVLAFSCCVGRRLSCSHCCHHSC
jgi:hypothetical protein